MKRSIAYREVGGAIRAPASKSSMQRAVACALLARGGPSGRRSVLRSPSRSADCMAALGAAAALGASVEDLGDRFEIEGLDEGALRAAASRSLSCGESGLCLRMFSPIVALFPGETELRAEGTLRSRSAAMIAGPLEQLGASCRAEGGLPPVRVSGPLRGGRARVDGRESSQLLTGLLVALPLVGDDSELEVEGLASKGYVDLTLDTMEAFGVHAYHDDAYRQFSVRGGQRYESADFRVEGDWSGAAFLLVAAALAANRSTLEISELCPSSSQPDRAIIEALRLCGAEVEPSQNQVRIRHKRLEAFSFDATDCPDLFPPLVVLASACEGQSRIRGARRLRGKESDRAEALRFEFGILGSHIEVEDDLMLVEGVGLNSGGHLRGGRVDSRGDHRIAMAAAVASLACESRVEIEGSECVGKSWPSFFDDVATIAR